MKNSADAKFGNRMASQTAHTVILLPNSASALFLKYMCFWKKELVRPVENKFKYNCDLAKIKQSSETTTTTTTELHMG